ncbi:MAG: hypothetical protein PVF27_04720 [Gemmatimonadales bacterium]
MALSQHDVPLWLRLPAAGLGFVAAWWLRGTGAIVGVLGDSVAPLALGVVSAFVLKGLTLPLGLWPNGPWRKSFSVGLVVLVALAFALLFVAFDPFPSRDWAPFDNGLYVIAVAGVVGWGFAWAMVRQRRFVPWLVVAGVAGLVPWVVGVLGWFGGGIGECALPDEMADAGCRLVLLKAFGYFAVLGTATALVTVELAFRRLVIGHPDRSGLVLIVIAAGTAAAWSLVMGEGAVVFTGPTWWHVGIGAVSAGALYVLSGSLLAGAVFSGVYFGGFEAIRWLGIGVIGFGWSLTVAHGVVAAALFLVVWRRKGLLAGLRVRGD